jgi:hypothetical protein
MAEYSLVPGSFQVMTDKSVYRPGETVTFKVAYDVSKSGWTAGAWSINASVYDMSLNLLDRDGETNAEFTTRSTSSLSSPKLHPRMEAGPTTQQVRIQLDADGVGLGMIVKTIEVSDAGEGETGYFRLATGSFQVRATDPPYLPNETVELAVAYDITRVGFPSGLTWSVNASVYSGGILLDRDGETNALTTGRSISSLANPSIHPRFKMGSADMTVVVKLEAVYSRTIYQTITVPLGTMTLTIPVAEEPGPSDAFVLAPGSFRVVMDKSEYKAGDTVKLYVGYDVMRNSNVGLSWSVNASVYDASGNLLDRDGETNAFTTARSVSPANSGAYIHPRFKMGNAPMAVKVVLDADGLELSRGNIVIPLSSGGEDTSPPENGGEEVVEGEEAMTLFGVPVMWLLIGGGLVVLLVATSRRRE